MTRWPDNPKRQEWGEPYHTSERYTRWADQPEITEWVDCLQIHTHVPHLLPVTYVQDRHEKRGTLSAIAPWYCFSLERQEDDDDDEENEWNMARSPILWG